MASALISAALAASARGQWAFYSLGQLPGGYKYIYAHDISGDGRTVVGHAWRNHMPNLAFRWSVGGEVEFLAPLPDGSGSAEAHAISRNGAYIVGSSSGPDGWDAVMWTPDGEVISLGALPGSAHEATAFDVSNDGRVVIGRSRRSPLYEAFRWTPEHGMEGLGLLEGGDRSEALAVSADGAVVTGFSRVSGGREGFLWTESTGMFGIGELPGGPYHSIASDMTADGRIVVGFSHDANHYWAVQWVDGKIARLPDLTDLEDHTWANAVSADGATVGGYAEWPRSDHSSTIWVRGRGMLNVGNLLEANGVDLAGWGLGEVTGVSGDGRVVCGAGSVYDPDWHPGAWVAVMP